MSKPIISLSFDDGNLDQFKWARGLYRFNIPGTFYVNPSMLDRPGKLYLWMLRKMHDEWKHVIANHMWKHTSAVSLSLKETLESIKRTDKWLDENGFSEGVGLFAFPYGIIGGRWGEYLDEIGANTRMMRDVSVDGENKKDWDCVLYALGDNVAKMFKVLNAAKDDHIYLFYFHHSQHTFDPYFVDFLERIDELRKSRKIDVKGMAELAR